MTTPKKPTVRKSNRSKGSTKNTNSAPRVTAAPVAVSSMQRSGFTNTRSRRIKNSEFIEDLFPNSNFAIQSYAINPGLAASFPWLSTQATNWQQYRFHSLRYRFVTRTGTGTTGSVILSPEYNSSDQPPTDERQAMNSMDAVEDVVWKEVSTTLNVAAMFPLGPRKQIRSQSMAGDTTVYDAGVLHAVLAYVGSAPSNTSVGKLWVDYDVELFVPQTTNPGPRLSSKVLSLTIEPSSIVSTSTDWKIANLSNAGTSGFFYANSLGAKTNNVLLDDYFDLPEGVYAFQIWASFQSWINPSTASAAHYRLANIGIGAPYSQVGYATTTRVAPNSTGEGVQLVSNTVYLTGTFEVSNSVPLTDYARFQVQNRQTEGVSSGGAVHVVIGGAVLITLL